MGFVVDNARKLVYVSTDDQTQIYDFKGNFIWYLEEWMGFLSAPFSIAQKPGLFSPLSTFEAQVKGSAVASGVVAGRTIILPVHLKTVTGANITEHLTQIEQGRFSLSASSTDADGNVVTVAGTTPYSSSTLDPHLGLAGSLRIETAGTWTLTFQEGTSQFSQQLFNSPMTFEVVASSTKAPSCSFELVDIQVHEAVAGEDFEIRIKIQSVSKQF